MRRVAVIGAAIQRIGQEDGIVGQGRGRLACAVAIDSTARTGGSGGDCPHGNCGPVPANAKFPTSPTTHGFLHLIRSPARYRPGLPAEPRGWSTAGRLT